MTRDIEREWRGHIEREEALLARVASESWAAENPGGSACPPAMVPTRADLAEYVFHHRGRRTGVLDPVDEVLDYVLGEGPVESAVPGLAERYAGKVIRPWRFNGVVFPHGVGAMVVAHVELAGLDERLDESITEMQPVLALADVDAHWRAASVGVVDPVPNPVALLVSAWQSARPRAGSLFKAVEHGYLARLQDATADGARLLDLATDPGGQLSLPLEDAGLGSGTPAFLVRWFKEVDRLLRDRGRPAKDGGGGRVPVGGAVGLPWSFRIFVTILVCLPYADRDGKWHRYRLPLDDVITWLGLDRSGRWSHRKRDYPQLVRSLDELGTYRLHLSGWLYTLVRMRTDRLPAEYTPGTMIDVEARTPPMSTGAAIHLDWQRWLVESRRALRGRAFLSLSALLDGSAHDNNAITRERWKWDEGLGLYVRVPNQHARYAKYLPEAEVARFLGLENTGRNRTRAAEAVLALAEPARGLPPLVELVEERGGWRVYGAPQQAPEHPPKRRKRRKR